MKSKFAIEAIEAVIENYEINDGGFDTWESARHVFDIYAFSEATEVDEFLVNVFLNTCKEQPEFYMEALGGIKKMIEVSQGEE